MRPELLRWLAESSRNFHLAGPGLSDELSRELWQEPWAHGAAYKDFPLNYEPRSLARSPNGRKVAVGTKAGYLLLASWDGNQWRAVSRQPGLEDDLEGGEVPRSIRAVRFLDNSRLVAGWGDGSLGVYDADTLIPYGVVHSKGLSTRNSGDRRGGDLLRFARFISLVPHDAPPPDQPSAVMLGVTGASDVHVLYHDQAIYTAAAVMPENVFPNWAKGARVVDGVWAHHLLWVLDSSGNIYRYAPASPSPDRPGINLQLRESAGGIRAGRPDGIFHLPHPREIGEFRAIASCVMGLSVLTSDDVTFLRFEMPVTGEDVPHLNPSSAYWIAVPSALDCSVCLPFAQYYPEQEPTASQRVTYKNPVWTVVGSSQPGLRWISWHDHPGGSGGRLVAVSHAHRGVVGDSSVIQVRFGYHSRNGPSYIACATRDHHLRIATLLDRDPTVKRLGQELPRQLEQDPSLAEHDGVAWWLALKRVSGDFDPEKNVEAARRKELPRLLGAVESEGLHALIRLVLREWEASPLGPETAAALVREWLFHILSRAYQVGPDLPQELAKLAHDRIAQMRGRIGKGQLVEKHLGPLAALLRKWVVYGHTYGQKNEGLFELYDWNHKSDNKLDALTYLTKLARRRVDLLWQAQPLTEFPAFPTWSLAAPSSGDFAIQSNANGSLTVIDCEGHPLVWSNELGLGSATQHYLDHSRPELLRRNHADEYLRQYRHGPYARNLLLLPLCDHQHGSYLLIFCFRGWRTEDHQGKDERKARLFALILKREGRTMRILGLDSRPLEIDLYGLCEIPSLSERGKRHVLIAGTRGAWEAGGHWTARPFIEIAVAIRSDNMVNLDVTQSSEILSARRGERSVFSKEELLADTAHNPCWSLASFTDLAGELWLCAGFHDGRIRFFCRAKELDRVCWREQGLSERPTTGEADLAYQAYGLASSGPVMRLLIFESKVLCYGTSDGVVGAVTFEGGPIDARQHWIHHRELSPICALIGYRDPQDGIRLLALSQEGIVALFDLDFDESRASGRRRSSFPGLLLDRFALNCEARAAVMLPDSGELHRTLFGVDLPAFLTASHEGTIAKRALSLPGGSERRHDALLRRCPELLPESLQERRWLRVLDVRGVHLLRFAIFWELRSRWPPGAVSILASQKELDALLKCLRGLADEVYWRRPLTAEPAKIIWEEAARIANQIAELAVESEEGPEREALLRAFLELVTTIDDLCNRWIGASHTVESRILIHTFKALFGWIEIVLIGLAQPTPGLIAVRHFLLQHIVQRRLSFNDRLVYLETLRTMNIALVRALRNIKATSGEDRWYLSLRPQRTTTGRIGLYDLLTTVGDLGEQHAGSLTPADPLWTELSRFFAGCLLLMPKSSFVISQVVAESRLTERDTRFASAVRTQVDLLLRQAGVSLTLERDFARQQFDYSFDADIDATIYSPASTVVESGALAISAAWRKLLGQADRVRASKLASDYEEFSNEAFLLDHADAIRTTAYMIWLRDDDECPSEMRRWLNKPSRYFEHSRRYLYEMQNTWQEIGKAGRPDAAAPGRPPISSITNALRLCDAETARLERELDLFEPQRTQYLRMINQWRAQIWKRAEDALVLVDTLDKYNRHTYRASSDRLMSSITELAMQTTPIWLDRLGQRPLRAELERQLIAHPLVKAIYQSGNQLVDNTHLAGTLFAVARTYYMAASPPYQTTLQDIKASLENFADSEGLVVSLYGFREYTAPGTLAEWETILHEIVRNTKKYCATTSPNLDFACDMCDGRVSLAFAGRRPFLDCLREDLRDEVLSRHRPREQSETLRGLLVRAAQPAQRLGPASANDEWSSGMGLPLLLAICRYLRLAARLELRDPRRSRLAAAEAGNEEALGWPLCLEIEWEQQHS